MNDVVNIHDRKPLKQKTTDSFIDARGQRHYKYQFQYFHDGRDWDFTIWAKSEEDAYGKLQSLARTALLVDPKPGAA